MTSSLFVVVERFHNGDPVPVYRRFREHGRLAPPGVEYVASWVAADLTTCWQVMRAESRASLDEWMARWRDLVDFEVAEVLTSADAFARVGRQLGPT